MPQVKHQIDHGVLSFCKISESACDKRYLWFSSMVNYEIQGSIVNADHKS